MDGSLLVRFFIYISDGKIDKSHRNCNFKFWLDGRSSLARKFHEFFGAPWRSTQEKSFRKACLGKFWLENIFSCTPTVPNNYHQGNCCKLTLFQYENYKFLVSHWRLLPRFLVLFRQFIHCYEIFSLLLSLLRLVYQLQLKLHLRLRSKRHWCVFRELSSPEFYLSHSPQLSRTVDLNYKLDSLW